MNPTGKHWAGNPSFVAARDAKNGILRANCWKNFVAKLGSVEKTLQISGLNQSTLDKLLAGDLSVDCVLAKRRVMYAINRDKVCKIGKDRRLATKWRNFDVLRKKEASAVVAPIVKAKAAKAKPAGLDFAVGLRAELISLIRKNGPDKQGNPVPLATSAIARHIGLADAAVEAILTSFGSDLVHADGKWSIPVPKVVEPVKAKTVSVDDGKTGVHLRHLTDMIVQLSDKIDALSTSVICRFDSINARLANQTTILGKIHEP